MKKRRILVIHESGTFQRILKRTLMAEVPDIDLHILSSAREAIERLEQESFDMVISGNEMEYMNGTDIYEALKARGQHKSTGFLLLTSKLDKKNQQLFKQKGINRVLKLPFQAGQLAHEIENLSHPREWRRQLRVHIPDTHVLIHLDKGPIPAELVDISIGGMLCNIKTADGIPQFSRFYQINILFPARYGAVAANAKGYILRQAALQWFEPPKCEILQMAWRLSTLSDRDTDVMQKVINKAFQHFETQMGQEI
jgi:CheY-like chemotaxis protein